MTHFFFGFVFFSFCFSTFLLFLSFPNQRVNVALLLSLDNLWMFNYTLRFDRS